MPRILKQDKKFRDLKKYQISGFLGDILKGIRAKIYLAKDIATIIPKINWSKHNFSHKNGPKFWKMVGALYKIRKFSEKLAKKPSEINDFS